MKVFAALCGLVLLSTSIFAQHGHLNEGAQGTNQGDKLIWANGAAFAASSGFIRTMVYTNGGRFSNSYNQNISFTALPATVANGGPAANHAALGAFIVADVVSVQGPAGGAFLLWDTNTPAGEPISIPVGTANGTYSYDLSDLSRGAGVQGNDPFGHIHNRRMGLSKPGLYTVGFRARDISKNGPNRGPIHMPSDVIEIKFESVTTFASITKEDGMARLTFKAEEDYHYDVEYTDTLKGTNNTWAGAGVSVSHKDEYITLPVNDGGNSSRFYRLKVQYDPH